MPRTVSAILFVCLARLVAAGESASDILHATGVSGGLVIHVGCGDGKLTAALGSRDRVLVHGLDRDAANVARTRALALAKGLHGRVTASHWTAAPALPLIDNLANLIVVTDPQPPAKDELLRVLAPEGVAYVQQTGKWTQTVKPRPVNIDEWTHYLHDAGNNAVAHDAVVGPPRRLQWQCGPRWSRHHDHMASMSALVSAGGRVFYILDEGSRVSPQLPADWKLIARDAFNGVLLWKRPIEQWHPHLWPLKSGPANLPRRLVAEGSTVYTTLGLRAPAAALDAASGETLREYPDSAGAEEFILIDTTLLALVNHSPLDFDKDLAEDSEQGKTRDSRTTYSPTMAKIWAGIRSKQWSHADRVIRAFEAKSGKPLWEHQDTVLPLTLAADSSRVYYHNGKAVVALDRTTGKPQWTSEPVPVWEGLDGRGLQSWFAPTLVVHDGTVLFAGGEKTHMSYMGWGSKDIGQDTMTALAAETGRKLWTAAHPYSGYNSPEDLFVIDGKAWVGNTAKGGGGGFYAGHALDTGEKVKDCPPDVNTHWFHHRCHRAKATDKYILSSRTGIEFVDVQTGKWTINHWVRGGCLYGIMPCNGLIYAPLHPCACYPEAKLYGFTALAPASAEPLPKEAATPRLEKGVAYSDAIPHSATRTPQSDDWSTYRHDAARSGATQSAVPADLKPAWQAKPGGRLTPPVVGGGNVFVADLDRYVVHALDAATGTARWSHIAGGRVDSPPTYARGRLLFGSADGHVYCLRASDGALAWRFRAAPADRRHIVFERTESVWPVHGAVLVQDGVATVIAGRSMYIDGGLRLCRLNVETGALLGEKVLDDRDPITGDDLQTHIRGLNMPVALPDILSSDGEQLYMRSQAMDLEGNRSKLGPAATGKPHLFAPYGFTDDSWFHRIYWVFGDAFQGGVGGFGTGKKVPAGRILVHDDTTVFGYGRKPSYYRWSSVLDYQLYAASRTGGASTGVQGIHFKKSQTLDPTGKPLTIAAWVKTDARDGTILVRGAQAIGFGLILTDRKPRMLVRAKGKTHEVTSSKPVGSDWTHVAGVLHKDGRMQVAVDGVVTGTVEGVPTLTGDPLIDMKVGYDDTNQLLPKPLTPLDGTLDEVMLFHRALSPEELQDVAAGRKLGEDGLVLHLDFTDGKARDRSPGRNHGDMDGRGVDGKFGQALLLEQPKSASPRRSSTSKSAIPYLWTRNVPMMVRAMVLADKTLLIAGPPDVLDEDAAFQEYGDPNVQKTLIAQDAAFTGKSGGLLHVVDAGTGETKSELKLDSPPVFDGLIVAAGRVFLVTMDGRVLCMGAAE